MKPSFPQPGRKPVDTVTARNAALVNQLATPGLGSLMAGRWIAGSGQLALAVAGCAMVVVWFFKVMIQYYGEINGDVQPHPVGWIGGTGGILFVASWFWALVTSISLFFEARRNALAESYEKIDSTGDPAPPKA
ncbi:MAG: hypothetical protein ABSD57_05845 [Verrucomicrobiota bacterium]|jgi:hypothetical protein